MESKILYTSETIKGFAMSCLHFLLVGIWIGMGLSYLITKDFYKKNVDN